jgi:hypothetical protein
MFSKLVHVFAFILGVQVLSAQSPEAWRRTEEGQPIAKESSYFLSEIAPDSTIIAAGYFNDKVNISRFDKFGNQLWKDSLKGNGDDKNTPRALAISNTGFVYVTGTLSNALTNKDLFLVCYDLQGNRLWLSQFAPDSSGRVSEVPTDIIVDNQGNICISGYIEETNSGKKASSWCYTPTGVLLWNRQVTGTSTVADASYAGVCKDITGNIYFAGYQTDTIGGQNGLITKMNNSGQVLFDSVFGNAIQPDFFEDVKFSHNSLYLFGDDHGFKYNLNAQLLFDVNIGFSVYLIQTDTSGRLILAGIDTNNNDDITIEAISPSGVFNWQTVYSPTLYNGIDFATSVRCDANNNIYVCGRQALPQALYDRLLLKLSPAGSILWHVLHSGNAQTGVSECFTSLVLFNDRVVVFGAYGKLNPNALRATITGYSTDSTFLFNNDFFSIGTSTSSGSKCMLDNNGNLIVAGEFIAGELVLTSYSPSGNSLWRYSYNLGLVYVRQIKTDFSGNIIVAGAAYLPNTGGDSWIAKFSPAGALLWQRSFSGSGNVQEQFNSIDIDNDNSIYAGGNWATNNHDGYVVKLDSSGTLVWDKIIGGTFALNSADEINSIKLSPDSALYILGTVTNLSTGFDIHLEKLDLNGDTIWTKNITSAGSNLDYGEKMVLYPDSGVCIMGRINTTGSAWDLIAIKYDPAGNLLWTRTIAGTNTGPEFLGDALLHGDSLFLSGTTPGFNSSENILTLMLDSAGIIRWQNEFNSGTNYNNNKVVRLLFLTNPDRLVAAGTMVHVISGGDDLSALVYTSSGIIIDTLNFRNTKTEELTDAVKANDAGFYITGQENSKNIVTIKICDGPIVSTGSIQNICPGNTTQLYASPGFTYQWMPSVGLSSATAQQPVFNGTVTTTYTVQATNMQGCVSSATQQVVINPQSLIGVSGITMPYPCSGDTTQLQAYGTYQYNWVPPANLIGANTNAPLAFPAGTTTYTITGTDIFGCNSDTATLILPVNPLPQVSVMLNIPDTLCTNVSPVMLTGGVPSGGNYSGPGINAGILDPQLCNYGINNFYYSYTDTNNCTSTAMDFAFVDSCSTISVNENSLGPDISIYPTFPDDYFSINYSGIGKVQIQVYAANGCLVFDQIAQLLNSSYHVNVSEWQTGLYFVAVFDASGVLVKRQKIIIQNN